MFGHGTIKEWKGGKLNTIYPKRTKGVPVKF
jgi:hypothetical protein